MNIRHALLAAVALSACGAPADPSAKKTPEELFGCPPGSTYDFFIMQNVAGTERIAFFEFCTPPVYFDQMTWIVHFDPIPPDYGVVRPARRTADL